jgi:hypothetical protein
VISAYCADSATDDVATWHAYMRHITGLVRPGGLFITAALHECAAYTVGVHRFPSANIGADDLRAALTPGFDPLEIQVRPTDQTSAHGYTSVLLCWARKKGNRAADGNRRVGWFTMACSKEGVVTGRGL